MQFGERLRLLRERKGVSLRAVGKATNMSGQYLWSLEHASSGRIPSPEKFRKLSIYYAVPVEDLLIDAGYLPQDSSIDESYNESSYDAKALRAFVHVINDPRFPRGKDINAEATAFDTKIFIIELYQRITGQKLL